LYVLLLHLPKRLKSYFQKEDKNIQIVVQQVLPLTDRFLVPQGTGLLDKWQSRNRM
jgi:hypothetical protein